MPRGKVIMKTQGDDASSQPRRKASDIKKNEMMPSEETWMDLEMIISSEVSQTGKDKYHTISLVCGI